MALDSTLCIKGDDAKWDVFVWHKIMSIDDLVLEMVLDAAILIIAYVVLDVIPTNLSLH